MSAASKTTTASARKTTRRTTRKRKPSKLHPATALMTLATIAAATGATGGDVDKALGECPGMASRYRVAALRYHPDKNPDEDAEERFVALSNAYQKKAAACARAGKSTKRPKGPRTAKHKSRRRKTASPRDRDAEVEEMRRRHAAMEAEEQARREREEGPTQQEEGGGGWGRASKTAGVLAAVAAAQGAYALNRRRRPTYRRGPRPRSPGRRSRRQNPWHQGQRRGPYRGRGGKRRRRKKKTRRRRRKRRHVSTRRRKRRQSGGGYFAPQNTPAPNLRGYRWSVPS